MMVDACGEQWERGGGGGGRVGGGEGEGVVWICM